MWDRKLKKHLMGEMLEAYVVNVCANRLGALTESQERRTTAFGEYVVRREDREK